MSFSSAGRLFSLRSLNVLQATRMMTLSDRQIFPRIFSFFVVSLAMASTSYGYPVGEGGCGLLEAQLKPGEKSEKIINQRLIQANAQVPQRNELINALMVSAYLTRPISAREIAKKATKEEIDSVETAMNGAHKKCGVSYRSTAASDFSSSHQVITRQRIVELVEGQKLFALLTLADGVEVVKNGPPFTPPQKVYPMRNQAELFALAGEVDAFFLKKENSGHMSTLVALGTAIESAFVHPKMKTAINGYQGLLRTRASGHAVSQEEGQRISNQVVLTMADLVASEVGPSMPNWQKSDLERLIFLLMRSSPEYFE